MPASPPNDVQPKHEAPGGNKPTIHLPFHEHVASAVTATLPVLGTLRPAYVADTHVF